MGHGAIASLRIKAKAEALISGSVLMNTKSYKWL